MLKRIRIRRFRNILDINTDLASGVIAIYGDNAQGKSNFLEAIYLLGYLNGFRNRNDKELIYFEKPAADVTGWLGQAEDTDELRVIVTPNKKYVKVNGTNLSRFEDYYGRLPVHLFIPQYLDLIRGEPSERRQTLDYLIVRLNPQLYSVYSTFRKSLHQRNTILKKIRDCGISNETKLLINEWERQLVNAGIIITSERFKLCEKLTDSVKQLYSALAFSDDQLIIKFTPNIPIDQHFDLQQLAESYHSSLHERFEQDIRVGFTTSGPQRDELTFYLNGYNLRVFGSQGQTRSAVLAFKLACCLLEAQSNPNVILCLDDALAELDDKRKRNLLSVLQDYRFFGASQTFITVAADSDVKLLNDLMTQQLKIVGGKLVK